MKQLSRGYAFATDEKGKRLQSVRQAPVGSAITVHVTDGRLMACVRENQEETPWMRKQDRKMTVEETFEALDRLIDELESGDGSLEDAFRRYEEGMKLVKSCNEKD